MLNLSFFSYKGGSGRSSLAYNTLPLLAENLGATALEPIIVLDLDIDSAGLSLLFNDEVETKINALSVFDVLNENIPGSSLCIDDRPLASHPFFSRLVPLGKALGINAPDKNKSVLFLPALQGRVLDNLDNNYNSSGNPLNSLIELCYEYNCKAIIFDTPAGDQLSAQWALDCSTKIAVCMRITYQFRTGTARFLKQIDKKYNSKEFIIVPNAVPTDEIMVEGVRFNYDGARKDIIRRMENGLTNNKVNFGMLDEDWFGIPEVRSFKVRENILYKFAKMTNDEERAFDCYNRFSELATK